MFSDCAVDVGGGRVGDGGDVELRELVDGVSKLGVCDSERDLLLVLDVVEEGGKHGCDLELSVFG